MEDLDVSFDGVSPKYWRYGAERRRHIIMQTVCLANLPASAVFFSSPKRTVKKGESACIEIDRPI